MDDYVLERGRRGARRLELLAEAMWPTTRALFERIGIKPGMRCLDVGCGVGMVSCELARFTGSCLGVDVDPEFIELSRRRATGIEGAHFEVRGVEELQEGDHDLAYARYLLSHLSDPLEALRKMRGSVRVGGLIVVEDIDFPGHFHHPPSPAFMRYIDLYQKVVELRGGNARVGRELLATALEAGLEDVRVELVVAVHHHGPSKMVAELTLEHIKAPLEQAGLASAQEIEALLDELRTFRQDPLSQISIAPTFQLVGKRSA